MPDFAQITVSYLSCRRLHCSRRLWANHAIWRSFDLWYCESAIHLIKCKQEKKYDCILSRIIMMDCLAVIMQLCILLFLLVTLLCEFGSLLNVYKWGVWLDSPALRVTSALGAELGPFFRSSLWLSSNLLSLFLGSSGIIVPESLECALVGGV